MTKKEVFELPMPLTLRCGACSIYAEALKRARSTGEVRGDEAVAAFMIGAADALRTGASDFRRGLCKDHQRVFEQVEAHVREKLGDKK